VRNENRTLCLDRVIPKDLPVVSVITVTRNHRRLFALPVNNFMNFDYPKDKLEWIIVDDSEVGKDTKPALGALRTEKRVKFVRVRTKNGDPLSIGRKRQLACENSTGDVILHMDDDDLVPWYAIVARIKSLSTYEARCVGSTNILCYDITSSELFNWPSADVFEDRNILPEAGMAYTRQFWKERGWEDVHFEEGKAFLRGRNLNEIVDIPSQFHLIAMTHVGNCTGTLGQAKRVAVSLRQRVAPEDIFPFEFARLLKCFFC
jgi:cellulose synthase/poly-beta-1,6-N-acetylglucosamine synthase-like glycosyltransferase